MLLLFRLVDSTRLFSLRLYTPLSPPGPGQALDQRQSRQWAPPPPPTQLVQLTEALSLFSVGIPALAHSRPSAKGGPPSSRASRGSKPSPVPEPPTYLRRYGSSRSEFTVVPVARGPCFDVNGGPGRAGPLVVSVPAVHCLSLWRGAPHLNRFGPVAVAAASLQVRIVGVSWLKEIGLACVHPCVSGGSACPAVLYTPPAALLDMFSMPAPPSPAVDLFHLLSTYSAGNSESSRPFLAVSRQDLGGRDGSTSRQRLRLDIPPPSCPSRVRSSTSGSAGRSSRSTSAPGSSP